MLGISQYGMGDAVTTVRQAGGIAAGAVPSVLTASGAIAAGSLAIPIIGAAIAGVTLAITYFLQRNARYHAEQEAATKVVDEAEPLLQQNLSAFMSSSKTAENKQAALQNFDYVWNQVITTLTQYEQQFPEKGNEDPAIRGITERSLGGKWDWFAYYRVPIEQTPVTAASSTTPIADTVAGMFSSMGLNVSGKGLLLYGGAAIILLAIMAGTGSRD